MLQIGIVGLPNVGKSTLFNALTDNNVLVANYPFATIEPNTGVVPVPDDRLVKLSDLYKNAPIKPATVTFVDIAGLVAGASKGDGLGNQFLASIRTCNAICHVVRAFSDTDDQNNPKKDIDVINTELVLADLQSMDKRLLMLQKEVKADPKLKPKLEAFEAARQLLNTGEPLFNHPDFLSEHQQALSELQLLTAKQIIYVFNVDEQALASNESKAKLAEIIRGLRCLFICAKLESELRGLSSEDKSELLDSFGQTKPGLDQLITAAYETLRLQSFLTAGEKEVRAWTIKQGWTAPQAAGVIHTDFERGFIAAEVVDYDELISAGSLVAAKAVGKVATVGKTYVMQPNDVVEFRFNVSK
jgi:ribosome-binding ATPase